MTLKLRLRLSSLTKEVKQTLKMFTSKAPMEYVVLSGKKTKVPIKRNFNLKEVPTAQVIAALDDIKKAPEKTLPQVLDLERPVNADYFEFIKEIWANRSKGDPYKAWNSVARHMVRALACTACQLETVLPALAKQVH